MPTPPTTRRPQPERILQGLLAVAALALGYVLYESFHERVVQAGEGAPSFSVQADNGRTFRRGEFGGKVLVLNFWATWCPPCIDEIPSLDQLQRQLGPSGLVVLAVSVDKDEAKYKKFLQQAGVSFATARDPEGDVSTRYGTFQFPETYIIDRDGKVRQKVIGPQNWLDPAMVASLRGLLGASS